MAALKLAQALVHEGEHLIQVKSGLLFTQLLDIPWLRTDPQNLGTGLGIENNTNDQESLKQQPDKPPLRQPEADRQ